ncbi:hypothetical protein [Bacillus sp. FJAT-26390]|uniref:hypothetical protein n=1 Tax=Bacillus sp. FJAT-26390 TaxID=1743142 RepID=UPI000A440AC0|nr:hypothetical protein [Bacillus sp. FJAT-26390]
MAKYSDEEIRGLSKITIKIAADYLGISPNMLTLGMRNDLLPITGPGFSIKRKRGIGGIKQFDALLAPQVNHTLQGKHTAIDFHDDKEAVQQVAQEEQPTRIGPAVVPIIEVSSSSEGEEGSALPEYSNIEMTRKQLYDEIWEISVAGVAKKYNLPYTHLMKQIKDAGIPIPPSGYWTKLNFNKPVTKLELPELADEIILLSNSRPSTSKEKRQSLTIESYSKDELEAGIAEASTALEAPTLPVEEQAPFPSTTM